MSEQTFDITFKHPFTAVLAGPSGSGKTTFVANALRNMNHMYDKKPAYTLFCYNKWQEIYDCLKQEGLIDEWMLGSPEKEYIEELAEQYRELGGIQIILDDLRTRINPDVEALFTIGRHHSLISVWFMTQNLYDDAKEFRTMKLNFTYLVLFKNPGDQRQPRTFFNSYRPAPYSAELFKIYQKVTKNSSYSYLMFDMHQETPEEVRIRTKIFPSDGLCEVFVPVD